MLIIFKKISSIELLVSSMMELTIHFQLSKKLKLTLDIDLQTYGDSLMNNKYGSIVAIEPKSGEILALVNSPGYDPNLLVGRERSERYKSLNNDSIGKPLRQGLQVNIPPAQHLKL